MTNPITVNQKCVVCSTKEPSNPLKTPCHHIFCRDCFILSRASQANDSCILYGRATQTSVHSLLNEDINTLALQNTALQTRLEALEAKITSTQDKIENLEAQTQKIPLEGSKMVFSVVKLKLPLLTSGITNLKNKNDRIQSDIEALQRISRKLSPFDSTPPIVNLPPLQLLTVAFNSTRLIASLISNALQRTPQPLSIFQSARQIASYRIISQGKQISIRQKEIQDHTMGFQTRLRKTTEQLGNIEMSLEDAKASQDQTPCPVCLETPLNPTETKCHHIFCRDCFILVQTSQEKDSCSLCKRVTEVPLKPLLDKNLEMMEMQVTDFQTLCKDLDTRINSIILRIKNLQALARPPSSGELETLSSHLKSLVAIKSTLGQAIIHESALLTKHQQLARDLVTLHLLPPASIPNLLQVRFQAASLLIETRKKIAEDKTQVRACSTQCQKIEETIENMEMNRR